MPFAGLRKKSSSKDIRRRSFFPERQRPSEEQLANASGRNPRNVRPNTAASSRAPSSIRPSSGNRPSSTHQPPLPGQSDSPDPRNATLEPPRLNMKMRYASDPQINSSYRKHAARSPSPASEAAPAPTIGLTPPSHDLFEVDSSTKKKLRPFGHTLSFRSNSNHSSTLPQSRGSNVEQTQRPPSSSRGWQSARPSTSNVDAHGLDSAQDGSAQYQPRKSESSVPYNNAASLLPPTNSSHRASTFLGFSRRKKQEPLFPLPVKLPVPEGPKISSEGSSNSPAQRASSLEVVSEQPQSGQAHSASAAAPPATRPSFARHSSELSAKSALSTPHGPPSFRQGPRSRSGTMNSFPGRHDYDRVHTPHLDDSGRNSTASTTIGRNSIAGLRSLTSRLRHPSEPYSPRHGSPGSNIPGASQNNSFALSRETLVVPEREEGETSGRYYARLEKDIPKKSIAIAFCKSSDAFSHDVLRSLLRTFKFYEEPMDMSLRRFLWEVSLPGEAQHIDRVVTAFAERYQECNPHIFKNPDDVYVIAFSLVILHSDLFNRSNKTKMQREQYQKNTSGQGVSSEILGYFYDNIHYTEFIQVDDDDGDSENKRPKSAARRAKRVKDRLAAPDTGKQGKLDPYEIIIDHDQKLDIMRPSVAAQLPFEDTYTYLGTANRFDIPALRSAFSRFAILQIMSARSRPEAFTTPLTTANPDEAQPGVIDFKVAKVGVLWRKTGKKRKTRSPWQEWGAILTQSQLYFFRNHHWVKGLSNQAEMHQKQGNKGVAVVFKPALTEFHPEERFNTSGSVALCDSNYSRHKHAFFFARKGVPSDPATHMEENLLADSEAEMNDWMAKINYASTFNTTQVRMQSMQIGNTHTRDAPVETGLGVSTTDNPERPALRPSLTDGIVDQARLARSDVTKQKLAAAEEEITGELKKLDDLLRTARHLEILAPFVSRTRGELLSFAARLGLNIKWSRVDVARLKCQRDILFRDLQEDQSTTSSGLHRSLSASASPVSPSRQSDSLGSPRLRKTRPVTTFGLPRNRMSYPSSPKESSNGSFKTSDIANGIDEAFATPPETLARLEATADGGLNIRPFYMNVEPAYTGYDLPELSPNPDILSNGRHNSLSSVSSQPLRDDADSKVSGHATPTQNEERRPSTAAESEAEQHVSTGSFNTNDSRAKQIRRSLQRTLREPRENLGSQSSRSTTRWSKNKDRDAASSVSGDDSMSQENENLARKPGSFTVHGKKASVVTIGNDWRQISPEERLRLRKAAAENEPRLREMEDEEAGLQQGRSRTPSLSASSISVT